MNVSQEKLGEIIAADTGLLKPIPKNTVSNWENQKTSIPLIYANVAWKYLTALENDTN